MNIGKYLGPSFITLEAKTNQMLRRGDIIQIRRSKLYMHTVIFENYDNCFHVTQDDDTDLGEYKKEILKALTVGTIVKIRKHPLEDILRKGYSSDDDQNQPLYCMFRVNNQEKKAQRHGISLEHVNSQEYFDELFNKLRQLACRRKDEEKQLPYHLVYDNCECYAYQWKYGKKWSPQSEFFLRASSCIFINWAVIKYRQTMKKFVVHIYGQQFSAVLIMFSTMNIVFLAYEYWDRICPYLNEIKNEIAKHINNAIDICLVLGRRVLRFLGNQ